MTRRRPWNNKTSRNRNNSTFYSKNRWTQTSIRQRNKEQFCYTCALFGYDTILNTHSDHIIPWEMGGAKYAAPNLGTICDRCHLPKTMREAKSGQPLYHSVLSKHNGLIPVVYPSFNRPISIYDNILIMLQGNIGAGKTSMMSYLPNEWHRVMIDQYREEYRDDKWAWMEAIKHTLEHEGVVVYESAGINDRLIQLYRHYPGDIVRVKLVTDKATALSRVAARDKRKWTVSKASSEHLYSFMEDKVRLKPCDIIIDTTHIQAAEVADKVMEVVGGLHNFKSDVARGCLHSVGLLSKVEKF